MIAASSTLYPAFLPARLTSKVTTAAETKAFRRWLCTGTFYSYASVTRRHYSIGRLLLCWRSPTVEKLAGSQRTGRRPGRPSSEYNGSASHKGVTRPRRQLARSRDPSSRTKSNFSLPPPPLSVALVPRPSPAAPAQTRRAGGKRRWSSWSPRTSTGARWCRGTCATRPTRESRPRTGLISPTPTPAVPTWMTMPGSVVPVRTPLLPPPISFSGGGSIGWLLNCDLLGIQCYGHRDACSV
jgi:hypothetical protein